MNKLGIFMNFWETKWDADYGKYMNSYLSMMEKFEAIDKDELSTADAAYYVEVSGRILKKLAEIAQ